MHSLHSETLKGTLLASEKGTSRQNSYLSYLLRDFRVKCNNFCHESRAVFLHHYRSLSKNDIAGYLALDAFELNLRAGLRPLHCLSEFQK